MGFLGGSVGTESACNAGDPTSIAGWGRSPGGGNGNPPQYSHLENPLDRGAWRALVHGVTESGTTELLTFHGCSEDSGILCSKSIHRIWDVDSKPAAGIGQYWCYCFQS